MTAAARFELASPEDDAALRRVLRDVPMEGRVRLAFTREPSYWAAARLEGPRHETLVLRGAAGKDVLAMGSRSVRDVWLNGAPARLGYLAQLRWSPGRRPTRAQLALGYARLRATRRPDELPFDLTSVAADNLPARRLLERGLPGLPRYAALTELETVVLPVRGGWPRRGSGAAVPRAPGRLAGAPEPLAAEALPELGRLLERDARARRLAPRWSAAALAELAAGALGSWQAVGTWQGGKLAASAALWDQRALRQVVVHSYDPLLARLRRWTNPLARLAGRPLLPPPGTALAMAYVSHLVAPDGTALGALLRALLPRARAAGLRYLALALPAGDPLLPPLRRFGGRAYRSVLYRVHGSDVSGEAPAAGPGDLRVEVATL